MIHRGAGSPHRPDRRPIGAGGDCGFEEEAIKAVRKWRYEPGTRDGQPVDVFFTVLIDFTFGDYRMASD